MLGSKNKEDTTSVQDVFIENYQIFFWTSRNNKMFKIDLVESCWDAIWKHHYHWYIKNWKSYYKLSLWAQ